MAGFSNYLEAAVLNHVYRNSALTSPTTVYLALYTSDPTEADSGTEVSGSGYARQAITFAAPSGGAIANSAQMDFTASGSWGTVSHIGIRDASSGGNLLAFGALAASQAVSSGNTLRFAASSITVSLD